jgi:hypothetical protein
MNKIIIKTPMWKNNSVGIADRNFTNGNLLVEIAYKNSQGQKTFPHTYKITKEKADTFPRIFIKGIPAREIPINQMEILNG